MVFNPNANATVCKEMNSCPHSCRQQLGYNPASLGLVHHLPCPLLTRSCMRSLQGLHQGEALAWMGTFYLEADGNQQSIELAARDPVGFYNMYEAMLPSMSICMPAFLSAPCAG